MENDFNKILKNLMEENSITYEELAKKSGYNRSTIGFWLSGTRKPTMESLIVLSKIFGKTIDFLVGLEDEYGNKKLPQNTEKSKLNNIVTISARGTGKKTVKLSDEQIASLKSIVEAFEAQKK